MTFVIMTFVIMTGQFVHLRSLQARLAAVTFGAVTAAVTFGAPRTKPATLARLPHFTKK